MAGAGRTRPGAHPKENTAITDETEESLRARADAVIRRV
jgi:hypothetical protein